jgi:capsid protein
MTRAELSELTTGELLRRLSRSHARASRNGHPPRVRNLMAQDPPVPTLPHSGGPTGQFEALANSPNRTPIPAIYFDAHRLVDEYNWLDTLGREALAGLARFVADNYPTAGYALDLIANYSVPVLPRAASLDAQWNKDAEVFFDTWAENADYTRRFDFETLQRLACFALDVDGDVGVVMQEGPDGLRLRFVPCWRIGQPRNSSTGPRNHDGVIVNADGVVTGYEVVITRNAQGVVAPQVYSPSEFLLLYEPERLERYRGLSALRRGANDIRDQNDIKAFEKVAAKIESAFGAVIQCAAPLAADWENPEAPSPGMANAPIPKSMSVAQLFGGEIPVIDGELKQLTSTRPGENKLLLLDVLAGQFVSGLGIPPAFFLDEKLTGPNQRGVNGKAQRKFDRRKKIMAKLARWTWLRVIGQAIDDGVMPSTEGWQRTRFQVPSLITIDIGDQMQADREAVAAGLMSLQRYHGNAGHDWQDEFDQVLAEDDYRFDALREQAARTGVPFEALLMRHGFTLPPPKPAPQGAGAGRSGGGPAASIYYSLNDGQWERVETNWPQGEEAYRADQRRQKGKFADEGKGDKGRSERAKATHKTSTREKQQRAEGEQKRLAGAVGGRNDGDNLPFDIRKGRHGIEVKTVMDNKNDKVTMHPEARRRKERQARKEKLVVHTVVIDVRGGQRRYLYKAGVGAFRLSSMEEVSLAGLKGKFK